MKKRKMKRTEPSLEERMKALIALEKIEPLKSDLSNAELVFQNNYQLWINERSYDSGYAQNPNNIRDEIKIGGWNIKFPKEDFIRDEIELFESFDSSFINIEKADVAVNNAKRRAYLVFLREKLSEKPQPSSADKRAKRASIKWHTSKPGIPPENGMKHLHSKLKEGEYINCGLWDFKNAFDTTHSTKIEWLGNANSLIYLFGLLLGEIPCLIQKAPLSVSGGKWKALQEVFIYYSSSESTLLSNMRINKELPYDKVFFDSLVNSMPSD